MGISQALLRLVLVLAAAPAASLTLDNGLVNDVDGSDLYDPVTSLSTLVVNDGPGGATTTANVTGGAGLDASVTATGSSVVDWMAVGLDTRFFASDDSIILLNGTVADGEVTAMGASHVEGGAVLLRLETSVQAFVNLTSGGVSSNPLIAAGTSVVETSGFTSIDADVFARDDALVALGDNTRIDSQLFVEGQGRITLRGIRTLPVAYTFPILNAGGDGTITLYGSAFEIDGLPVGFGTITATDGLLSGTFEGDRDFSLPFLRTGGTIELLPIPEPATGLLIAIGLVGQALTLRRHGPARRRGGRA